MSRYNFNGFTFGNDGDYNLVIEIKATGGIGYNTKIELELTAAERQELIATLLTATTKKGDDW
jgi:hypothetical protein